MKQFWLASSSERAILWWQAMMLAEDARKKGLLKAKVIQS